MQHLKLLKIIEIIIIILIGLLVFKDVFASPAGAGIYIDRTTENFLKKEFEEIKSCGNFPKGDFDNLKIIFMPPRFPCKWYAKGCGGEFLAPNTIKISNIYYWKHELIHYFLFLRDGKTDVNHESNLYLKCI